MASNIDVTLKRYNGTDYDLILPTTHLGQLYTDSTLTTTLSAYMDGRFTLANTEGVANGVATLNASGKLVDTQVPDYLFGGLKFVSTLDASSSSVDVSDLLQNAGFNVTDSNYEQFTGYYWIVSGAGDFTSQADGEFDGNGGWDDGVQHNSGTLTLEVGDWIVLTGWDAVNDRALYSVINNTYDLATDAVAGIVKLSDATNTTGTSNDVITENILGGLILGDNSDLNGTTNTNLIAPAAHHHDGRYYTEGEISQMFSGASSMTGYNKTNWDLAYAEKINSASFDTNNGVLSLTQQDTDIIAVDLDGRFAKDIAAAQTDSTDGIVVAQTGNDFTIAHFDTSSVANVTNTLGNVIQSMTFDTFGHLQTHASVDLDGRYYTESEIDDWIDGAGTINGNTYVPILYGASPTSSITGALIIDID